MPEQPTTTLTPIELPDAAIEAAASAVAEFVGVDADSTDADMAKECARAVLTAGASALIAAYLDQLVEAHGQEVIGGAAVYVEDIIDIADTLRGE